MGGREGGRGWSKGSTGDVASGKGRLQLVFYCSTPDETEELGLGKQSHPVLSHSLIFRLSCPFYSK